MSGWLFGVLPRAVKSLYLCGPIQWAKGMVKVEAWTLNTGNILWKHCTLTCSWHLTVGFKWSQQSTRLFLDVCLSQCDTSLIRPPLYIYMTTTVTESLSPFLSPYADIWGYKTSYLCPYNYWLFFLIRLPFFPLLLPWSLGLVSTTERSIHHIGTKL